MTAVPRVAFASIHKTFPGVTALDDVTFAVEAGSVHALLGENGAGKSTLIKILAGAHRPTRGRILLDGTAVTIENPHDAFQRGIGVVYQELTLVPELTVAENVRLGHWPTRHGGLIDRRKLEDEARRALDRVGSPLRPSQPVAGLSVGQQQAVEIARALAFDARILVLDEPSAVLTPYELEHLFTVIRQLRDQGVAIIYISHRLEEIFALADHVTVLRDGRHVSTRPLGEVDRDLLVRDMVGRSLPSVTRRPGPVEPRTAPPALTVRGLTWKRVLHDITFDVAAGEVFGLSGLVGAGRTSLLRAIFGALPHRELLGQLTVAGRPGPFRSPREAIAAGVALLPEDRKDQGLLLDRSLRENTSLASLERLSRHGFVQPGRERTHCRHAVTTLGIRASHLETPVITLSGGNQQKVVLGRWLDHLHRVVLFDEPTRGVDVGAKEEIYDWIDRLSGEGAAVVVSSSELPEIIRLSDRIGVMRGGRLVTVLDNTRQPADQETLLRWASPPPEATVSDHASTAKAPA